MAEWKEGTEMPEKLVLKIRVLKWGTIVKRNGLATRILGGF